MKSISVSKDIVPIAEFKSSLSKWFKSLRNNGHPLIITQNGRPAGVLLTPKEYDDLVYRKAFFDSLERGISDAESGKTYSTKELRAELAIRRNRK
jgi:antitoxin YefM